MKSDEWTEETWLEQGGTLVACLMIPLPCLPKNELFCQVMSNHLRHEKQDNADEQSTARAGGQTFYVISGFYALECLVKWKISVFYFPCCRTF